MKLLAATAILAFSNAADDIDKLMDSSTTTTKKDAGSSTGSGKRLGQYCESNSVCADGLCCSQSIPKKDYDPSIKGDGFARNPEMQQYCFDQTTTEWYNEVDETTYRFRCLADAS